MIQPQSASSQVPDGRAAPFAVHPVGDSSVEAAVAIAAARRDALSARLLTSGALLFRGFDLRTPQAFGRLVDAFSGDAPRLGYSGGASPRRAIGGGEGLYSSTEYPPAIELSLHNELSYADVHPRHLFFFCLVAPESGGATTLGDSRRILARIGAGALDRFRATGLRYIRNLSPDIGSGYSWQDAFETEDPAQAEAACRRVGAEFEWRDGGYLRVSQVRPATARHPVTGEEVWFNQADGFHPSALDPPTHASLLAWHGSEDAFRLNVTFGDGTPIARELLDEVRAAIRAERVEHRWEAGDVLVLDNFLTAHGRAPFSGPRKIALAMI